MTSNLFTKIAEGLNEAIVATAMAKSDAEFDGRPWGSLGRRDRERYLQRSMLALAAALSAQESNAEPEGRAVEAIKDLRERLATDNPDFAKADKETKEVLIVTASDLRRILEVELEENFDGPLSPRGNDWFIGGVIERIEGLPQPRVRTATSRT